MSELRLANIPPPTGGIDLVSAPDDMGSAFSPWMENFLPGVPGKLPVRGPVTEMAQDVSGHASKPVVCATYNFATNATWITRATDAPDCRRPDEVFQRPANSNAELDTGNTYNIAGLSDLSDGLSLRTFYGPGAQVNGSVWGFEYDSPTSTSTVDLGLVGPRQWQRHLIRITAADAAETYDSADAPTCGIDVTVHLNRLFVLGGYPPGVTVEPWSFSCLFFMETDLDASGGPLTGTITDWQTITGVTNRIDIPGPDVGKAVVPLNQYLVIFKEESIWVLYGSSPDSFTLRKAVDSVGCMDRDSIVEADGGIYFRSRRGIEFFDGASCSVVSGRLTPVFEDSAAFPFYLTRTTAGVVGPNFIEFRIQNIVPGEEYIAFWMNRSDRTWTVASGTAFENRGYWIRGIRAFISEDYQWGSYLVEGHFSHLTGDGISSIPPYGTGGPGVVGTSGFDNVDASDFSTVGMIQDYPRPAARVIYPRVSLVEPRYSAQLHRAFLDTKAIFFNGDDDDATDVWTWQAVTSTEESYMAGVYNPLFTENIKSQGRTLPSTPIGLSDSQYWLGRRTVVDTFSETDDLFFIVEYDPPSSPALQPARAEIYSGGVEYQVTRQRRTTVPRPD